MKDGSLQSDGAVAFRTGTTDIWASTLSYRALDETIGGVPDTVAPTVTILAPLPGATLDGPYELRVRVEDQGASMGLKSLVVNWGQAQATYAPGGCAGTGASCSWSQAGATFSTTLLPRDPTSPNAITVTARDHKGNAGTATVSGLLVPFVREVEPNSFWDKSGPRTSSVWHVEGFTMRGDVSQEDEKVCRTNPPSPNLTQPGCGAPPSMGGEPWSYQVWYRFDGRPAFDFCEDWTSTSTRCTARIRWSPASTCQAQPRLGGGRVPLDGAHAA